MSNARFVRRSGEVRKMVGEGRVTRAQYDAAMLVAIALRQGADPYMRGQTVLHSLLMNMTLRQVIATIGTARYRR